MFIKFNKSLKFNGKPVPGGPAFPRLVPRTGGSPALCAPRAAPQAENSIDNAPLIAYN